MNTKYFILLTPTTTPMYVCMLLCDVFVNCHKSKSTFRRNEDILRQRVTAI